MFDWSLLFFLYAAVSFLILLMPVVFVVHRKMISQMVLECPDVEAPMGIGLREDELEELREASPVQMKIENQLAKGIQNAAEEETIAKTSVEKEAPEGTPEETPEEIPEVSPEETPEEAPEEAPEVSPEEQENRQNLKEIQIPETPEMPEKKEMPETPEEKEIPEIPEEQTIQTPEGKKMEMEPPAEKKEVDNPVEKDIRAALGEESTQNPAEKVAP